MQKTIKLRKKMEKKHWVKYKKIKNHMLFSTGNIVSYIGIYYIILSIKKQKQKCKNCLRITNISVN